MLCHALSKVDFKLLRDARQDLEADPFEEMMKEIDAGIENIKKCLKVSEPPERVIIDIVGLCNVVNASLRLAVKARNPKLVGLLLKTVLLLADDRQIEKDTKESLLLKCGILAFGEQDQPNGSEKQSPTQADGSKKGPGGPGIQSVLSSISSLLPNILPTKSGFSQQTIEFLRSKSLFISHDDRDGFNKELSERLARFSMVTMDTTTFSADSVVCAVSESEKMEASFDHVWLPLTAQRLIYFPLVSIWDYSEEKTCAWLYRIPVILVASIACVFALLGLALYPLLLIYFYLVHGFKSYAKSGGTHSAPSATVAGQGAELTDSIPQAHVKEPSDGAANGNETGTANGNETGTAKTNGKITSTTMQSVLIKFCYKPIESFEESLKGTQSVAGHVLSLPGVGSLKSLRMLCTAPIDVFEAPAVRAAVEGMWSRFMVGFWVRSGLYLVHLLLFSAFAAWCVAHDLPYSTVNSRQDGIVRASFNGGCVAVGICTYFLLREAMQCVSCVTDEGLKDYIEFWNVLQTLSLSLELASFAMFVSESDPVATRLVTTYAVIFLWINLLYFTKAIRQISFLLQILVTIVSDMIPFLCILAVFVMAIALALQVLVGKMLDPENPDSGEVVFASFGAPLDLVLRMAEGRQDMGGSVLEMLTKDGIQSNAEGAVLSAISCTIYLCFYFLFFFITIIALNALIALMGSSYEKVMEKKISQRWYSMDFLFQILTVTHYN